MQDLKIGEIIEYKGQEATIVRITRKWTKIIIKETGEFRFIKTENVNDKNEK